MGSKRNSNSDLSHWVVLMQRRKEIILGILNPHCLFHQDFHLSVNKRKFIKLQIWVCGTWPSLFSANQYNLKLYVLNIPSEVNVKSFPYWENYMNPRIFVVCAGVWVREQEGVTSLETSIPVKTIYFPISSCWKQMQNCPLTFSASKAEIRG